VNYYVNGYFKTPICTTGDKDLANLFAALRFRERSYRLQKVSERKGLTGTSYPPSSCRCIHWKMSFPILLPV